MRSCLKGTQDDICPVKYYVGKKERAAKYIPADPKKLANFFLTSKTPHQFDPQYATVEYWEEVCDGECRRYDHALIVKAQAEGRNKHSNEQILRIEAVTNMRAICVCGCRDKKKVCAARTGADGNLECRSENR